VRGLGQRPTAGTITPPYMVSQKVADEMLLSKVAPEYPDAVKNANTSGQIVIM